MLKPPCRPPASGSTFAGRLPVYQEGSGKQGVGTEEWGNWGVGGL